MRPPKWLYPACPAEGASLTHDWCGYFQSGTGKGLFLFFLPTFTKNGTSSLQVPPCPQAEISEEDANHATVRRRESLMAPLCFMCPRAVGRSLEADQIDPGGKEAWKGVLALSLPPGEKALQPFFFP